jgi:hypothetical protein
MINTSIFLATSFQDTLWVVLLIVFAIVFYKWSKSKITNSLVAVVITLVLTYIIFIRYTELVWILAIGIIIYWIYGSDIKSAIKLKI